MPAGTPPIRSNVSGSTGNPQGSRPSPSEQQDSLSAQRWTNLDQNQSLSSPFPSSFFNSGASGGLPMTYRAGGEFHGSIGLSSSDLSEIASREQKLWRLKWLKQVDLR